MEAHAKLDPKVFIRQSLPPEHGSWAFVLEPLLIAIVLDVATNWAPAIGAFLSFLAFRPMSMAIKDLTRKKRYPRTMPSLILGALLGLAGLALLALGHQWPYVLGAGALYLVVDHFAKPRSLVRELVGALLLVCFPILVAPFVWPLFVMRPLVSVLSVRGVLARMPDHVACRWVGLAVGALLPALALACATWALMPLVAYSLCAARAVWLALTPRHSRKPVHIGAIESLIALAVVGSWIGFTLH